MKAWFISRHLREKLLLLVFVVAAAVFWLSDLAERGGELSKELRYTRNDLSEQASWIANKDRIAAAAEAAIADLDSARTYNSLRLSAELSTLAKDAAIDQSLRSEIQPTQQTAQFAVHTVQLTLSRVQWENLLTFYQALSERAPYISIERFKLDSVRGNPDELNARLLVSSVEIAEEG